MYKTASLIIYLVYFSFIRRVTKENIFFTTWLHLSRLDIQSNWKCGNRVPVDGTALSYFLCLYDYFNRRYMANENVHLSFILIVICQGKMS